MTLDLHGAKHADVCEVLDKFIYQQQVWKTKEVRILTGKSAKMKKVVNDCLADYGLVGEESILNGGALIVTL